MNSVKIFEAGFGHKAAGSKPFRIFRRTLVNRLWDYPRHLRRRLHEFDLFHVVDHSYAQLVHVLPPERTGVFCHDLDTFRCLLEPARAPRPEWFRAMARRILRGLQKAAVVFHNSLETRRQIERFGLIDPQRLVHAPLGVSREFTAGSLESEEPPADRFLLHVGSCIRRKRIDVLLQVFAEVRTHYPDLKLVKVGGPWQPEHKELIDRLGLTASIQQYIGVDRATIARLYRQAALVLMPSEAEGFGLPVIEALACGSRVVASDLAVLREVGGRAAVYCPVADVAGWSQTVCRLLADPALAPQRSLRIAQAQRFSWAAHAEIIVKTYLWLAR
jgi:glycosyltransferase involved in cell wall biosynthesis